QADAGPGQPPPVSPADRVALEDAEPGHDFGNVSEVEIATGREASLAADRLPIAQQHPASAVPNIRQRGKRRRLFALEPVHAAGPLFRPSAVSHCRTARSPDAGGMPVRSHLCYPSRSRCRIHEDTAMTVGHILNQKGTAVVTARPNDTVHEVG